MTPEKPTQKLKKIVSFIINVYAPLWFGIKKSAKVADGARLFFKVLTLLSSCPHLTKADWNSCAKCTNFSCTCPLCMVFPSLLSVNPVSLGGLKAGQPKPGGPALSQQQQARLLRA